MKFSRLAIGARFEFEGRVYIKEGPLAAREVDTGRLRMIPRYALLKPAEDAPKGSGDAGAPAKPAMLPRETVLAAFEAYHAECAALLPPEAAPRLAAARARFLASL